MRRFKLNFLGLALTMGLALASVTARAQTPPPNDNFTNRTILSGAPVTFSGTTSNATSEVLGYPDVWYSWTATESSRVILERLAYSSPVQGAVCVLDLFRGTNFNGADYSTYTNRVSLGSGGFTGGDLQTFRSYLSFNAVAGEMYHFRFFDFFGPADSQFTMRLFTTSAPVILSQPQDQTVTENDSAIFTVKAYDRNLLTYQWRHNGTNLLGENTPALMLLSPVSTLISNRFTYRKVIDAGDYDVVLSDPTGTNYTRSATSAVAHLTLIPPPPIPAKLTIVGSNTNRLVVKLDCEPERQFVASFSTNLAQWWTGNSFMELSNAYLNYYIGKNSTISTPIFTNLSAGFLSVQRWHLPVQVCTNNLKILKFAKDHWAFDNFRQNTDTPVLSYDLQGSNLYFRGSLSEITDTDGERWWGISCPAGGNYTIGGMTVKPTCSIPGHTLSE